MASLKTLLEQRNQQQVQGSEELRGGSMYYFTHTDYDAGCCQFCWISPGTGVAVVELWGGSGSGGMMCCCGWGAGVPGNPGAYSKKTVPVTSNTYICGWVGQTPTGNNLCYPGRSGCSVACIICAPTSYTMIAEGGFGGYNGCSTSTAAYCCFGGNGFCTTYSGSVYCGIVCNVGGPNGAVTANASGGDVNLSGGISCTSINECCNYYPWNYWHTLAISPGIYSSTGPTCVKVSRSVNITGYGGYAQTGRQTMSMAINSLSGSIPSPSYCWSSNSDCGCYEASGCYLGGVGIPGTSGFPCSGVRSMGVRGGSGAIKITYYT